MSSDDQLSQDTSYALDSHSTDDYRVYDNAIKALDEFRHLDISEELDLTGAEVLHALLRLEPEEAVRILTHADFSNDMMVELVCELERQGWLLPLMQDLLSVQLHDAADPATLFREDHVSTRLIQVYLFTRQNRKFLAETVAPIVHKVAKRKQPIELNPARVQAEDVEAAVEEAGQAVEALAEELLAAVATHLRRLPLAFGYLVADTKARVAASFPGHEAAANIECVFFFLRFVCPALVSPLRYGVPLTCSADALTAPVLKGLVYVSKVLQAVGSGVEFDGSKEQYMARFNGVVAGQQPAVRRLYAALLSRSSRVAARLEQKRRKRVVERARQLASAGFMRRRVQELGLQARLEELAASLDPVQALVHPALWDVDEVAAWLRTSGLAEFVAAFRDAGVDGVQLLLLTGERLSSSLGLAVRSQRQQVQAAQQELLQAGRALIAERVDLSSPSAAGAWLKRGPLRPVARVLRKLDLPAAELLALSADDLLLCGLPRAAVEQALAALRSQRYWLALAPEQQALAALGAGAVRGQEAAADARLEQWFLSLSGSLDESDRLERPVAPSAARVRWAFEPTEEYVSGKLRLKSMRKWKEFWLLLVRSSRILSVYPAKAAPAVVTPETVRTLGVPLKRMNILNCTIQDGSGFTGKPGSISIFEKGKHVRYVRCPSQRVADLWIEELLKYTLIMAVEKMNLEMFDAPAVASTDQGVIVGANKAALLLWGYEEQEVVGENVRKLMPAGVAKFHNSYLSAYRKYRDRRLIGKKRVVQILRKDGSEPHCIIRLGEFYEGKQLRFVATFNYDDAMVQQELDLLRSNVEAMLETSDDDSDDTNWSDEDDDESSDAAPCGHALALAASGPCARATTSAERSPRHSSAGSLFSVVRKSRKKKRVTASASTTPVAVRRTKSDLEDAGGGKKGRGLFGRKHAFASSGKVARRALTAEDAVDAAPATAVSRSHTDNL